MRRTVPQPGDARQQPTGKFDHVRDSNLEESGWREAREPGTGRSGTGVDGCGRSGGSEALPGSEKVTGIDQHLLLVVVWGGWGGGFAQADSSAQMLG